MKPEDAIKILGLLEGATEKEREGAFKSQRAKLEQKLAQAPTPGLQNKYREALRRLEEAYETLELTGEESDLPALRPDFSSRKMTTSSPDDSSKPPQKSDEKNYEREIEKSPEKRSIGWYVSEVIRWVFIVLFTVPFGCLSYSLIEIVYHGVWVSLLVCLFFLLLSLAVLLFLFRPWIVRWSGTGKKSKNSLGKSRLTKEF